MNIGIDNRRQTDTVQDSTSANVLYNTDLVCVTLMLGLAHTNVEKGIVKPHFMVKNHVIHG